MQAGDVDTALSEWLRRVCATEKPPPAIVAFNIGLFETSDGFSAYLVGARQFDPESSDWACDESFTPRERYLTLPLRREDASWEEALHQATTAVRGFLAGEGAETFLAKAQAVTIGFDAGDLVRLK